MFRITINALWSKDYLSALAKVLAAEMQCSLEESFGRIREIGEGKALVFTAPTMGRATGLASDILQYGCFLHVEQIAPINDENMIADLQDWLEEDMSMWRVFVADDSQKVTRLIENNSFAYLAFESQAVTDHVGSQLLAKGAMKIANSDWPATKTLLDQAIAENELRRSEIRAARAAFKKKWKLEEE